jgi:ATP-dependent RNA helicase RhlE
MSDFKSMNLLPAIQEAIKKQGYETPTPIQEKSIPHLLEGKDLLGIAQTGTGKTAAFALPIIDLIGRDKKKMKPARTRVLILTPTRELASQIDLNVKQYSKGIKLTSTVIFGGVGHRPQVQAMSRGVDVLVATPGRLLDLMGDGHVNYEQLEVFILDEADRMLDMGFFNDVKRIISKLPKKKQTLLFSATMPGDIAKLANSLLQDPIRVEVTPQATTVEKIAQSINMVETSNKPLLLKSLLKDKAFKTVLVFSRTKHGADRIVKHLERENILAAAIHGNKSQGARERALGGFRTGRLRVLVATDIAARGIDIPDVSHVINYNLPNDEKSYVHRIGRTARAGREGIAISFCDKEEEKLLRDIQKFINYKIPVDKNHPYHGAPPSISKRPVQSRGNTPSRAKNPNQSPKPASNRSFRPKKKKARTFSRKEVSGNC